MALPTHVKAESCWGMAEMRIAEAIATLPAAHTFLGVLDTESAKKGNLYFDAHDGPVDHERYENSEFDTLINPSIIVGTGESEESFQLFLAAQPNLFVASGSAAVTFRAYYEEEPTMGDRSLRFKNEVSKILEELTDLDYASGGMDFQAIRLMEWGIDALELKSLQQLFMARFELAWGTPENQ
jgi:hypothetical protein